MQCFINHLSHFPLLILFLPIPRFGLFVRWKKMRRNWIFCSTKTHILCLFTFLSTWDKTDYVSLYASIIWKKMFADMRYYVNVDERGSAEAAAWSCSVSDTGESGVCSSCSRSFCTVCAAGSRCAPSHIGAYMRTWQQHCVGVKNLFVRPTSNLAHWTVVEI